MSASAFTLIARAQRIGFRLVPIEDGQGGYYLAAHGPGPIPKDLGEAIQAQKLDILLYLLKRPAAWVDHDLWVDAICEVEEAWNVYAERARAAGHEPKYLAAPQEEALQGAVLSAVEAGDGVGALTAIERWKATWLKFIRTQGIK